jgi:hypothetical protein
MSIPMATDTVLAGLGKQEGSQAYGSRRKQKGEALLGRQGHGTDVTRHRE